MLKEPETKSNLELRKEKIRRIMKSDEMSGYMETKYKDGIAFHIHEALLRGVAFTRAGRTVIDDVKLEQFLNDPKAMIQELWPR